MSLVIIACDSTQAVAVSDGRASTVIRKKQFLRDDHSKILQLSPDVCVAATGKATVALFIAVKEFVRSWHPGSSFGGLIQDMATFAREWLKINNLSADMVAAFFGWDHQMQRIRLSVCHGGELTELSQPNGSLPMHVVLGKTDGIKLAPDTFAVRDPVRKMREIISEARDSDIGHRTFEYCVQAPTRFLNKPMPGRVWPAFDAAGFTERLNANPPAEIDSVMHHVLARIRMGANRQVKQ